MKPRIFHRWVISGIFFCLVPYLAQIVASNPIRGAPPASVPVGDTSRFTLASASQGREVLGRIDAYIQNQTGWERGARLNKIAEVSAEDYAQFCRQNVLDWTDEEYTEMLAAMKALAARLKPYARWMPTEVLIVKTSGDEDYGVAYTRGNAIVIESHKIPGYASSGMLAHELWHVISRHQAVLRDEMYAVIGFHYCGPVHWIAPLDRLHITNPDCPINQHAITIKYKGQEYMAMPIIYSRTQRFGIDAHNNLNAFMNTRLLLVKSGISSTGVETVTNNGEPMLLKFGDVEDFREQVGFNTNYLVHPEEIIADNFEILVEGKTPRSPEITAKLKKVLLGQRLDRATVTNPAATRSALVHQ